MQHVYSSSLEYLSSAAIKWFKITHFNRRQNSRKLPPSCTWLKKKLKPSTGGRSNPSVAASATSFPGRHHLQREDEQNPIVLHLRQEEGRLTDLLYIKPLGHTLDIHSHYARFLGGKQYIAKAMLHVPC